MNYEKKLFFKTTGCACYLPNTNAECKGGRNARGKVRCSKPCPIPSNSSSWKGAEIETSVLALMVKCGRASNCTNVHVHYTSESAPSHDRDLFA